MKILVLRKLLQLWVCILLAVSAVGCDQERTAEVAKPVRIGGVMAIGSVLAEIAEGELPAATGGPMGHASTPNGQGQIPVFPVVFSEWGDGVAYAARSGDGAYVVHRGKRSKPYQSIDTIVLSRDAGRIAYGAAIGAKWHVVVDGKEGRAYDYVGLPRFSPDGLHVLYDAKEGDTWYLVLDEVHRISCPDGHDYYDTYFSDDSRRIVYIENSLLRPAPMRIVVCDTALRKVSAVEVSGVTPVYNRNRTRMAVIQKVDSKKRVAEADVYGAKVIPHERFYDEIVHTTFSPDGTVVAYIAEKGLKRRLVVGEREVLLPEGILREPPVVRPDRTSAGVIIDDEKNGAFFCEPYTATAGKRKYYQEAAGIIYNGRTGQHAYIAKKGKGRIFMVVDGKEGPSFDMVVTPQYSPDGTRLVYRARKDGKRFVVVSDAKGRTLKQCPAYEQVFQPAFTDDGRSIAYGVKDGNKLVWRVEKLTE